MAVSFTLLMLLSAVPAVVPTAGAQAGAITVADAHFRLANSVQPDGTRLAPGTAFTVTVNATVATCAGPVTAFVDIGDKLFNGTAGTNFTLTQGVGTSFSGTGSFTLGSNVSAPGAEGTALTFPVTVACNAAGGSANGETQTSPAVNVDTRPPRIATSFVFTNASTRGPAIGGGALLAIGSRVDFTPSFTDANLATGATVNLSAFNWSVDTSLPVASGGTVFFTVNESSATYAVDNASRSLVVTVSDAAGNLNTTSYPLTLDNVKPPAATLSLLHANLTRAPTALGGSQVDYMLGVGGGATAALARVSTQGASAPMMMRALTGKNVFAVNLTDPYTNWVNMSVFPMDDAGNANYSDVRAPNWTQNVTVSFAGRTGGVVTPTTLGSVTVTLPTDAPIPGQTLTGASNGYTRRPIFLELQRAFGPGELRYWKNSSAGSSTDNFQAQEYLNTGLTSTSQTALVATALQPTLVATPTNSVTFTNLTGRSFMDGAYRLLLNMSYDGDNVTRTQYVFPFSIDANAPTMQDVVPGQALGMPTLSATTIHGGDGNPIRVVVNVTDTSASPLAIGIRNVTVEVTNKDQSAVAALTNNGAPARLDFGPADCRQIGDSATTAAAKKLPYCFDLSNWTATNDTLWCTSPASHDVAICNAYDSYRSGRGSLTFFNDSSFSGYVNLSFPNLPAGKYKVRLLATDNGGNAATARVFPSGATEFYLVSASVRLETAGGQPRLTSDNRLEATVYTGAYYAQPPPVEVANRCAVSVTNGQSDRCPARNVTLYLSNSNTGAGVVYVTINGFRYANTNNLTGQFMGLTGVTGRDPVTGALTYGAVTTQMFQNVTLTLPSVSNVNVGQTLYVRAEVNETLSDGTILRNSTEWIRVSTPTSETFRINKPAIDWSIARAGGAQPAFNVTLNRTGTTTGEPTLSLWVYKADREFTPGDATSYVSFRDNLSADACCSVASPRRPIYSFNWTGTLRNGTVDLQPGEYRMEAIAYDPSTGSELGRLSRPFAIVSGLQIPEPDLRGSAGVSVSGNTNYVLREFDVPFRVNHGLANLTRLDQLEFRLTRSSNVSGVSPNLIRGEQGFEVTWTAVSPLAEEVTSTDFVARVTLPTGLMDGEFFRLNITAIIDTEPHTVGNLTRLVEVFYDDTPPASSLSLQDVMNSVYKGGSTPPVNKVPMQPIFMGYANDPGAGISSLEVRIRDLTANRTVFFTSSGNAIPQSIDAEGWFSNTSTPASVFSVVDHSGANVPPGSKRWTVNLANAYDPNAVDPLINLSHTYRVEVRGTDGLGRRGDPNPTTFDLDGAAPYLGFNGALGTPVGVKSGIFGANSTNWHGSRTLVVNVTDNHCLAGVWLVGKSDKNPNVIVKAPMRPIGINSEGRACYNQFPVNNSAGQYVQYQIDLANHPNMTDDVSTYTYWWMAVDDAGQTTELPEAFRTFRMQVLDTTPATVGLIFGTPSTGQLGAPALIRADIFDNANISHVNITFSDVNNPSLVLARGQMRAENTTSGGWTRYVADTSTDLNLTLEVRDYLIGVAAYDVNWNRTGSPGPTCNPCLPVFTIYRVRDDGIPLVALESPRSGAFVNASPTIVMRGLHKALETTGITVRATADGNVSNLTVVPPSALNFTLLSGANNTKQGYTVRYTAANLTDNATLIVNITLNVGGVLAADQHTFRVDARAPTAAANVTDTLPFDNKTWITGATRIALTANDSVSPTTIVYTVNNGTESTYTSAITPSGQDGEWRLTYRARDAAGNVAPEGTVVLTLDRTGPRISVAGHGDEVVLTVTDGTGIGVNDSTVTVHYKYGNGASFVPITATRVAGGNTFRASLPGNASATGLSYYFTALDALGNQGTNFSATTPYVIRAEGGGDTEPENEPPTVSITAPASGSTVTGSVEIRWTATDPEQAPISITLTRTNPDTLLVAGAENSGRYTLNLTTLAPGTYTVVITASDGEGSATDSVTFTVAPRQTITLPKPLPASAPAGVAVPLEVSIAPTGTTVSRATYTLVRNNAAVASGPLTRNAAGNYAATVTANESGVYGVLVEAVYANGTTETRGVGQFAVQGETPPPETAPTRGPFPVSLMVLAALAVVVIALAAYGAFGRWRK